MVGVGLIGRDHVAVLHSSPLADLALCCDTDPSVAGSLPAGVKLESSLESALETPGLEAVFICTPQPLHRQHVEAALDRGLAVFCEKPIAASLSDADAIISAASRPDARVVIGHTLRFNPHYLAVQQEIAAGALGRLVHVSARRNIPDFEAGPIAARTTLPSEVGVHDLDFMVWTGGSIERVYGEGSRLDHILPGAPEAVVATLRFSSGAVGVLELNWVMPAASGKVSDYRFMAVGTEGVLFLELNDEGLSIFTKSGPPRFPRPTYMVDAYGTRMGTIRTEDDHFLQMVRDGRPWPLSLGDARAALVAALAIDRSVAEGRPVKIAEMG